MRPTLCFVLVVALIGCGDVEESAAPEAPWQAPADADEVDWARAHYLGAEACAACHEKRWHEFSRTGHFNTLRLPDDDIDLLALADAPSVLLTRNPDLQFVMTRDATGVHQRAELVGADGVIERVSARVDLIMGSGKIFEGYLHWEGDALFQLPVGKMSGVEGFSNCPGYRDGEARFDRAILPRCLECHATWVESRPGEGGNHYDPDSLILGISCERCHGPGSEHVAWHEAQPRDPIGRRIVRPSELDRERRLDICAQCHGDPGVLLGQAFSYRPGTDLADHVEQTSEAGARGFVHTANQIQKLRDSACFQGSDKLECLTCHSPHRQERERLSDKARQACLRCHEREACGEQAELIASVRDDCAACHMPRHQVIDTTFSTADADHLDLVRMTDHRIGIYPAATLRRKLHALSSDAPELREMTAQLVTAIRQQAEADQAHGRWIPALAAWREIERLTGRSDALLTKIAACLEGQAAHERSEARYELAAAASARGAPDEAIALLEDSVAGNPHHAGSWHALAVLRSERGPPDRALAALDGAVDAGAGTAEIFALRGALRLQAGQLEGAESDLRKALEQGPPTLVWERDLGTVLLAQGRLSEAARRFRSVLDRAPADSLAMARLATVLSGQDRRVEAQDLIEQAEALAPNDPLVLRAAVQVHAASGNTRAAQTRLEQIIELQGVTVASLNELGWLRAQNGDVEGAISTWTRSLDLDATQAVMHLRLGRLLAENGIAGEARTRLASAEDLAPAGQPAFQAELATAWLLVGEASRAVGLIEALLQRQVERDPRWLLLLAEAQMSEGQIEKARAALRAALELLPADSPEAASIRSRLQSF